MWAGGRVDGGGDPIRERETNARGRTCTARLFTMARPMPLLPPVTRAHSALYFFFRFGTGRRLTNSNGKK